MACAEAVFVVNSKILIHKSLLAMDDLKIWLGFIGFFLLCGFLLWWRIKQIMDSLVYNPKDVVCARVKREEDGRWMCKFFLNGNHFGYLTSKPSSDRVNALVVGFDEKLQIYKLREVHK